MSLSKEREIKKDPGTTLALINKLSKQVNRKTELIANLKDRQETFNAESDVALNQFNKGYFNGKAEVLSQVITALENNATVLDEEI